MVTSYDQYTDRIRERFATLSRELPGDGPAAKRIVFYRAGEVAEVGYICLHGTDLQLVGVVNDQGWERFFDIPVYDPALLHATLIDSSPFGRLVVMSFRKTDKIRTQLEALTIPPNQVFWI